MQPTYTVEVQNLPMQCRVFWVDGESFIQAAQSDQVQLCGVSKGVLFDRGDALFRIWRSKPIVQTSILERASFSSGFHTFRASSRGVSVLSSFSPFGSSSGTGGSSFFPSDAAAAAFFAFCSAFWAFFAAFFRSASSSGALHQQSYTHGAVR